MWLLNQQLPGFKRSVWRIQYFGTKTSRENMDLDRRSGWFLFKYCDVVSEDVPETLNSKRNQMPKFR